MPSSQVQSLNLFLLDPHSVHTSTPPYLLSIPRGSENFHKMGRVKISLIKDFLLLGVSVVISDIDTAWIQNPLPYFNRFPQAHILTSTGECES